MKYKTYTAIAALVSGMALFNGAAVGANSGFNETTDGRYVLIDSTTGAIVDKTTTPDAVGVNGAPATGYAWRLATFADAATADTQRNGVGELYYDTNTKKLVNGTDVCSDVDACKYVNPTDPIAHSSMLPDAYTYRTKSTSATDATTGNSTHLSANGYTVSNGDRSKSTSIDPSGIKTTGSIHATEGLYLGTYGGGATEIGSIITKHDGQIAALEGWRGIAQQQIASLQHDMKTVQGGVALALALDVPHLETGKRFGVAVNMADFEGTGAFAGGVALRLNETWQVNAGGGFGLNGGAAGGKVGIVGQW